MFRPKCININLTDNIDLVWCALKGHTYRKSSIKCHSDYSKHKISGAALNRGQRLFKKECLWHESRWRMTSSQNIYLELVKKKERFSDNFELKNTVWSEKVFLYLTVKYIPMYRSFTVFFLLTSDKFPILLR